MSTRLSPSARVEFLSKLRDARALILRDAESFHEAATVLEQLGQVIGRKMKNGLAEYENEIVELVMPASKEPEESVRRLFTIVREARNKAVHEGAYARHLNSRLVDLLLIIEEAIMANMERVEELMVRNPIVAEPWHLVGHVRRTMLANSFSNLPYYHQCDVNGKWLILRDTAIIRVARTRGKPGLSMPIAEAVSDDILETAQATTCNPETLIDDLLSKIDRDPVLVVQQIDSEERLLGIITAFDLL